MYHFLGFFICSLNNLIMLNIYFFLMDFSKETCQMVNVFNGPHIQSVAMITSYTYNPNESTTNHFSIPLITITSQHTSSANQTITSNNQN